jgi:tight adherence protein B
MLDGSSPGVLAAALAAIAFAALIFAVAYPYFSGDRQKDARYRSVLESKVGRTALAASGEALAQRRKTITETLKDLEERQRAAERLTLRLRLQRAGLDITPKIFWLGSILCGLGFALAVDFTLPPSGSRQFVAFAAGLIGTFGMPRWLLNRITKRRQAKFIAELPNAIEIVVRGVKSGLPLNECLGTIARESAEPLASEFREVVEQQRVGVSLGEALDRLANRMPLAEVRFLSIVIAVQQQAGGNLSEALGNLAGVLRDRFRLAMKVKALSAEAKASAIVLASLPPAVMFMVYGAAPDYIAPLFNTRTGNFIMVASAMWMLMGVLVMRKMINFKF